MAAAVILFLLARLTQVGWLFLVDAVLWGVIILSTVCPWLGVASMTARRRLDCPFSNGNSPGPSEGDSVQITLTLRARAFWPGYVFNLFYDCAVADPENRLHRFFVTNVSPSGQVSMASSASSYQRGLHQLGPVTAESTAPFGLFRRRRRLTPPEPVLVYPQVHVLRRMAMTERLSGMESRARKSRTGNDPAGSRQYISGDSRRLIHWRNTARTGRLMVKELEEPVDRTAYLLFDATRVWGEGRETTLEYAIKLVASVAHYAYRNQVPVQVLGGGLGVGSGSESAREAQPTQSSWPRLLKELALVTPGGGRSLAESLTQLPPDASVLVAVSPTERPALEAIDRASSTLHRLVVVTLEGFGEPQLDGAMPETIRSGNLPLIPCRPGQLQETLSSLESLDGPHLPARRSSANGRDPALPRTHSSMTDSVA